MTKRVSGDSGPRVPKGPRLRFDGEMKVRVKEERGFIRLEEW